MNDFQLTEEQWKELESIAKDDEYLFGGEYDWNKADCTIVGYSYDEKLSDVVLSKGAYRLKIGNPSGDISDFSPSSNWVNVAGINKEFSVDKIRYDYQEDKLYVDIDIKDNPIPAVVIWGAVIIAVSITGALTVNSILEDITPLTKSPFTIGIMLIFLIPVVISLIKVLKK